VFFMLAERWQLPRKTFKLFEKKYKESSAASSRCLRLRF
jgi:hypothetical protein